MFELQCLSSTDFLPFTVSHHNLAIEDRCFDLIVKDRAIERCPTTFIVDIFILYCPSLVGRNKDKVCKISLTEITSILYSE